jgi:hypothetical protein
MSNVPSFIIVRPFGNIPDLDSVPLSTNVVLAKISETFFKIYGAASAVEEICRSVNLDPGSALKFARANSKAGADTLVYAYAPNIVTYVESGHYCCPSQTAGFERNTEEALEGLFFSILYPAATLDKLYRERPGLIQALVVNTSEGYRKFRVIPSDKPLDSLYQRRNGLARSNGPV